MHGPGVAPGILMDVPHILAHPSLLHFHLLNIRQKSKTNSNPGPQRKDDLGVPFPHYACVLEMGVLRLVLSTVWPHSLISYPSLYTQLTREKKIKTQRNPAIWASPLSISKLFIELCIRCFDKHLEDKNKCKSVFVMVLYFSQLFLGQLISLLFKAKGKYFVPLSENLFPLEPHPQEIYNTMIFPSSAWCVYQAKE